MINLKIDDQQIQVPEGTTVLRAAQANGIEIPTLCDHPALTPYGGCRLCLVDVEGARTLQPSCTMPVSENMVVHTNTPKVKEARKFVLSLIFSERNHFCPYCQVSGGDCELQNSAYDEGMDHWPLPPNWKPFAVDASHPYFILDNNRCILCRRCVRACGELVGNFTLGIEERGASSILIADFSTPLGQSSCISCGECVEVCPTGALIDRWSAYRGKETQVETVHTICAGCSIGCGIRVLTRDNHLVRIEGDWDHKVNDGVICEFGRFKPMDEQRERVVTPLVRKNGALKAATWDEAIATAVEKMKAGSVAGIASTRLTAEALYEFKKIAEKLGSTIATTLEEGVNTASAAAVAAELSAPIEGSLDALKSADVVLVAGADVLANHQVAGFFIKRSLPLGTRLIVLDPKENKLDNQAEISLKAVKGSDADVIEALASAVGGHGDLAAAAEKTGIALEDLTNAVALLSAAKSAVVVYGKGITAQKDTTAVKALVHLSKHIKGSLISVKGDANSVAAEQYKLTGAFDPEGLKTVIVALGDDNASKAFTQRVEPVPFKIVLSSYISPLTAAADVVLPVGTWLEQEGHYVNVSGLVQKSAKAIEPKEGIVSAQAALEMLAAKLGVELDGKWQANLTAQPAAVKIAA